MPETPEQFQAMLRTWNKSSLVGSIWSLEARLHAVWKDPGYGDIPPQAIADALSALDNLRIAVTGTFKCNQLEKRGIPRGRKSSKPAGLPSMAEMIISVLREAEAPMRPQDLLEQIRARYWTGFEFGGVGSAVWRMCRRGELINTKHMYSLAPAYTPTSTHTP